MGGDLMSYVRKAYEKDLLRRYGYVPNKDIELLELAIESALTDRTIRIDNVEKLVSLSRPENDSVPILKQILTELEREERQRPARKGQMRRTGRNQ